MSISIPKSFLEQIQLWMIDNDYECGPEGSEIYNKITEYMTEASLNQEITCCTI